MWKNRIQSRKKDDQTQYMQPRFFLKQPEDEMWFSF